jgi:hypothetical protein
MIFFSFIENPETHNLQGKKKKGKEKIHHFQQMVLVELVCMCQDPVDP